MTDQIDRETGRLEQILKSVDFFKPAATRRGFMQKMLLASGGAAVAATGAGKFATVFAALTGPVGDFVNDAVGAERIGIAFYGNALGMGSDFSVGGDPAKNTLLNNSHRGYFMAAFNQESSHLATLQGVGGAFPFSHFAFPAGTFGDAPTMLAMGQKLESIFIGAYLGAVKACAGAGTSFGITVAEVAAQICGIECEHRVLINDIAGVAPPNDRFYEGDVPPAPSAALGNSGARSTVYATGGDAVDALVALGITPS